MIRLGEPGTEWVKTEPDIRVHAWPAQAGEGVVMAVQGAPYGRCEFAPEEAPIREAWERLCHEQEVLYAQSDKALVNDVPPEGLYLFVEGLVECARCDHPHTHEEWDGLCSECGYSGSLVDRQLLPIEDVTDMWVRVRERQEKWIDAETHAKVLLDHHPNAQALRFTSGDRECWYAPPDR